MTLAIYIKDDSDLSQTINRRRKRDRIFALTMVCLGFVSIVFAIWPIISWQVYTAPFLSSRVSNVPIPTKQILTEAKFLQDVRLSQDSDGFSYFTTDYKPQGDRPKEFKISIPKLEIEDAIVKVDTLVFYENLSHFPGSALPGQVGNVFITGHSVLPQFTDTKNYLTIFSKLPDLDIGDTVFVNFEDHTYQYAVQYKKIVDPKDVSVIAPISKNGKNLTLMTCVPPGTSLQRMVVITSLI